MAASRRIQNWPAALAGLITFLVYLPSLQNGFVNWDDFYYVYENPHIRSMEPAFFKWALTSIYFANYHPLTIISYAVDYWMLGLNPAVYHFTNIVFHALNTGLFYILGLKLFEAAGAEDKEAGQSSRAAAGAFVAALLFGLHPLHVESVSWISERKDVLSGFFFILGAIAYVKYALEIKGRRAYYALTLLLFLLAVMSKSMALSFPVVLLILDWYPLRRFKEAGGFLERAKRALVEKIPFILISLVFAWLAVFSQRQQGAVKTVAFSWRALMAVRGYMFYLYRTALPFGLAPFYPHPTGIRLLSLEYAGALASFAAVTIACALTYKKRRALTAAWLYYLVTLLPVIGLVQVGAQAAADRYSYLPSISVFLLAGAGSMLIVKRLSGPPRAVVLACVVFMLAALSFLTIRQEAVWKDSVTLWTHQINTVAMSDKASKAAYYNRGLGYAERGAFKDAVKDYNAYLDVDEAARRDVAVYVNRGVAYMQAGELDSALKDFNMALELKPGYPKAYLDRGIVHLKAGRCVEAIDDLQAALKAMPDHPLAIYNLGVCCAMLKRPKEAESYFKKAAALGMRAPLPPAENTSNVK